MKKIIKVLLVITFLFISSPVFADTTINLDIETSTGPIYNGNITVAPCDSENDGVMKITAYCALAQSGIASDWSGLWVNSINGIVNNDNNNGVYWMWLANLNTTQNPSNSCSQDYPYSCSAKQYILNPNDKILFYYNTNPLNISVNNSNPTVGDSIKIDITKLGLDNSWNPAWNPAVGGKVVIGSNTFDLDNAGSYSFAISDTNVFTVKGQLAGFIDTLPMTITPKAPAGGGIIFNPPTPIKAKFDLQKAFSFITSQQKEDGSFGENLYTDWTALSFSSSENFQEQKTKLIKYFGEFKTKDYQLTDYERHAMALMALGLDPYNINSENYIGKITAGFDGKQFGDINQDNDDIFALIVLQNAGYTKDENIIKDTMAFILSKQKEDGSWDGSVDMTGAGIEALASFNQDEQVKSALTKAEWFLKQNQKNDGGFGNVSSTAWAIEGILALNEKPEDWIKNDNTPLDYLATNQDTDGGTKGSDIQSKIWETAYAVTALSNKTWNQIMLKFEKPEMPVIIETKKEPVQKIEMPKKIVKKTISIIKTQNVKKLSPPNNTATAVNTITPPQPVTNTEIPKKNWFMRFLDKIFNIF